MTIRDWQRETGAVARSKGFQTKAGDIHRSLLLTVGELVEAQNELRTAHEPQEIYFNGEKPEGFPIELADAVLRLLSLSHDLGIDLQGAMEVKHAYNTTRPVMHGGKLF